MNDGLSSEERELLDKIANEVVRRGLTAPAILFLASLAPMNFVASQAMLFFAPMIGVVVARKDYDVLQRMLERRESVELIVSRIEQRDAESRARAPGPPSPR